MTVPGTRSGVQPLWPSEARTPAPAIVPPPIVAPVAPPPVAPPSAPLAGAPAPAQAQVAAAVLSKVDQKVAAIAARGPEYEAIAKLSREIIERIVWEIVPDLAEAIVREELHKRGRV